MAATDFIEVIGVRDYGDLNSERVLFRAKTNFQIGYFLVLIGKSIYDRVKPNSDYVYWFPDGEISAGEYIRLYSKDGINNRTKGNYGPAPAVFHNFYWRKRKSIWAATMDSLVVLHANEWNFVKVK